jgi:hypothetical protein
VKQVHKTFDNSIPVYKQTKETCDYRCMCSPNRVPPIHGDAQLWIQATRGGKTRTTTKQTTLPLLPPLPPPGAAHHIVGTRDRSSDHTEYWELVGSLSILHLQWSTADNGNRREQKGVHKNEKKEVCGQPSTAETSRSADARCAAEVAPPEERQQKQRVKPEHRRPLLLKERRRAAGGSAQQRRCPVCHGREGAASHSENLLQQMAVSPGGTTSAAIARPHFGWSLLY